MQHKFRKESIHAELELVAKEFDEALPPQKNDKAEYLLLFIEDYPNAELVRALPIVEKNFLDKSLKNGTRRKCARMLGEIGESRIEQKTASRILELLLIGMGESGDPYMVCECMDAIGKMADARRWHEFDSAIPPLLRRVANEKDPENTPNILERALTALERIKPNDPYCLGIASDVRRVLEKKRDFGNNPEWDAPVRKILRIREGWKQHLEHKGVLEKGNVEPPKQPANSAGGSTSGKGGRRRITP